MFETGVGDGAKQLGLQKKVAEASRVDTDIAALLVSASGGSVGLFTIARSVSSGGRDVVIDLHLLIGVVDELVLVIHGAKFDASVQGQLGWMRS